LSPDHSFGLSLKTSPPFLPYGGDPFESWTLPILFLSLPTFAGFDGRPARAVVLLPVFVRKNATSPFFSLRLKSAPPATAARSRFSSPPLISWNLTDRSTLLLRPVRNDFVRRTSPDPGSSQGRVFPSAPSSFLSLRGSGRFVIAPSLLDCAPCAE